MNDVAALIAAQWHLSRSEGCARRRSYEKGHSVEINDQLLIEEYKSCRDLILKNIDIMEKNEIYATGACAAIFVFSLQTSDHLVSKITARVPLLIAALGWLRFYGLDDVIDK